MKRALPPFVVASKPHAQARARLSGGPLLALGLLALLGCSDRPPTAASDTAPFAAHVLSASQPQTLIAEHPAMRLRTTFSAGRATLRAPSNGADQPAAYELGAVAWGCAGAMGELPTVQPRLSASRVGGVEYRHADLDEWYVTGAEGVEQGFTLRRLPKCVEQGGTLRIELAFQHGDGYSSAPSGVPNETVLSAPGNRPLHYGKAHAEDAAGTEYAVAVATRGTLALELDASHAILPLLIDPLVWIEEGKLSAPAGMVGDAFGSAVALSGNTALVGAPGDDGSGVDAGAAYVFVRSGTSWTLQQKLQPTDISAGDAFGTAVALSGDTALVGAANADGTVTDSGAAYVFMRVAGAWTLSSKLTASDPLASAHFGASVALAASLALIGAPNAKVGSFENGAAYLFQGPSWAQQTKLTPSSSNGGDHNGTAVAISGGTLAIGGDRATGQLVSFYQFDAGVWGTAPASLSSTTSPTLAHFGSALALSTNYTVLGAKTVDPTRPGSVLVVSNADHATQFTLQAADGAPGDGFGSAVAISGIDLLLVGSARNDGQGVDSGSVYVFGFTTNWTQQQKLTASGGAAADGYGSAVSTAGNQVLFGAPSFGTKAGAAYVEAFVTPANGTACAQDNECGSGFCVEKVCCNSACTGTCKSCLQKNKGNGQGADGVCGNVRANTDPLDACPTDDVNTCSRTGVCNGQGACTLYVAGTSCTLSECASPKTSILNSACNGLGACKPVATVACPLGSVCIGGTCKSGCAVDTDCDTKLGFFCTPNGDCKKPKGSSCATDNDCSTGTCQFGSCCLADADGLCSNPNGSGGASGSAGAAGQASDGGDAGLSENGQGGDAGFAQGGLTGRAGFGTGGASDASTGFAGNATFGGGTNAGSPGNAGNAGFGQGGLGTSLGGSFSGAGEAGSRFTAGAASSSSGNNGAGSSALPNAGKPGALEQDQLVTACGCRVAGNGGSTSAVTALSLGLVLGAARRRKHRSRS